MDIKSQCSFMRSCEWFDIFSGEIDHIKTWTMKVLLSCRRDFEFFGIAPPSSPRDGLINKRNSTVFIIFVQNAISASVFFFYKAENIAEYADSFSVLWSMVLIGTNFSLLTYKIRDMYTFIESLESAINESMPGAIYSQWNRWMNNAFHWRTHFSGLVSPVSRAIYEKYNQQVEKYGDALVIFMRRVSIPCFICPKFIVSFATYFTTDLGNDAFQLPYHLWWVWYSYAKKLVKYNKWRGNVYAISDFIL